MTDGRILVFAKPAIPGRVKTRLVPPLTHEEAAELHRACLDDVVRIARAAAADAVELFVAGDASAVEELSARYPELPVRGQEGDDLGARLARAFEEVFERGIRRVLIVGSDHPTLPADRLAEGLERLYRVDVVFGPTDDGGYYAVGLRDAARDRAAGLFSDVPWSTRDVLDVTRANARALGLSVGTLDAWYDIDRPDDLDRLRADATADSEAARTLRRLGRDRESG